MSIIQTLLDTVMPTEQSEMFKEAYRVLTSVGRVAHIDRTESLLGVDNTASEYATAVRVIITEELEAQLRDSGVYISQDVVPDITIMTTIVNCLGRIPATDTPEVFLEIVNNEEYDSVEMLIHSISQFEDIDLGRYYEVITECSDLLMSTLRLVLEEQVSEIETALKKVSSAIRNRVGTILRYVQEIHTEPGGMLADATSPGIDAVEASTLGYKLGPMYTLVHPLQTDHTPAQYIADIYIVTAGSNVQDVPTAAGMLIEAVLEPLDIIKNGPLISRLNSALGAY